MVIVSYRIVTKNSMTSHRPMYFNDARLILPLFYSRTAALCAAARCDTAGAVLYGVFVFCLFISVACI